jgi:hypothetical protein
MDEARRFLRYIVPGILFLVEGLLFTWILFPDWAEQEISLLTDDAGVGFALAGILGSGGLGFLFSLVHHQAHWSCPSIDFRNTITRARNSSLLTLADADGHPITSGSGTLLTARQAWVVVTAIWSERRLTSKLIEGAEPRASTLADLVHSLGTGRIATACALFLAFAIAFRVGEFSTDCSAFARFLVVLLVWLLLLCAQHSAYKCTGAMLQLFVEIILLDVFAAELASRNTPAFTRITLS